MSLLKRRGRVGHRLNRFNPPRILLLSYWLPHDMSRWLPVADCLPLCVSSPSSCLLAASYSPRSSVSLIRPVVRVVPRFSVRLPISSCCLALSYLLIGHVRLVSSAHPLIRSSAHPFRPSASPCFSSPFLVSAGGASSSRFHLVMRLACRLCVSLVLFSACLPLY